MRTIYINAVLTRVVRILKNIRLAVGDVLPKRQIRVSYCHKFFLLVIGLS
jgi:hypothetical protein